MLVRMKTKTWGQVTPMAFMGVVIQKKAGTERMFREMTVGFIPRPATNASLGAQGPSRSQHSVSNNHNSHKTYLPGGCGDPRKFRRRT